MKIRRRVPAITMAALAVLVATSCEPLLAGHINDQRAGAGQPALPQAQYLDETTDVVAADMCATGTATPTPDLADTYGGETAVGLDERVGVAPIDRDLPTAEEQLTEATDTIWAGWSSDPTFTDARWDDMGVATLVCGDDLYAAAVLREGPSMPATGRYSAPVYDEAQIERTEALQYGTAVNHLGQTESLLLDLWLPPDDTGPRPLMIWVHGGGFSSGSRNGFAANASRLAQRGFAVASIDYRLRPNQTPAEQLAAAMDAIDDAQEAVRWLRSRAGIYNLDTARFLAIGGSAGAATVYGIAHVADPTPGGPLAGYSADVAAVMGSGGHLTPGLDLIDFAADAPPTMLAYFEQDTNGAGTPWPYAYETCEAIRDGGSICDFVKVPGEGHTISMNPGAHWWADEWGPFTWHHLDLADAAGS
jgi:poly(3-hydroxybutyrate) depolymerase